MSRTTLLLLLVAGCGRSSLNGASPYDCLGDNCGRFADMKSSDLAGVDLAGVDLTGVDLTGVDFAGLDLAGADFSGVDLGDLAIDLCANPSNCSLPACVGDPRCHLLGTEICNNCVDDNDDGLIDCADPQCKDFPGCQAGHTCDPNHIDCTDPQCACGALCKNLKCHPTVDFGTLNPTGSSSTKMVDTKGTIDVTTTPCAPGGAGMVVGEFNLTGPAAVVLSYTQGQGEDHVFGIFAAGTNQPCGANPIENACYDPKSAPSGSHSYLINSAGEYYVITQPFEPAGQGPVTVTLSTGCAGTVEICNNGVDDNCNGLVDCADPQCVTAANCVKNECMPDFNVGALVVNGPAKMVSFDTSAADVENNLTCQAAQGGKDVVVRFTLDETAGVEMKWDQSGDHVVGLFKLPDPGEPCDFSQISCYDPSARTTDDVAWDNLPAGSYVLIFKATKPGDEGHIDASISAFAERMLCQNPIDCAELACFGVNGCTGPYCMPDLQLGELGIGASRTVMIDVTQGITGYKTSCAKGGGKAKVVQLTIPSPGPGGGVGIGFDCSQTGDQVLGLFAQTTPRAACDADEIVCADPSTLPFGCGYEVPNLAAGTYDVIVEAFSAGSEGSVDLTLSVVDDRQLVDCRQPGACSLRYCVTSQYCMGSACKADATIDPVPLDGSQVFRLVQTAGNGVAAAVPCATTPGGQTAIIGLQLTAAADLTLQWQQIGNHDFALYSDDGAALPCDAGTVLQCQKGGGLDQSGSTSWSNVPQGNYWLVVGADAPDGSGDAGTGQSSGSVTVVLSGMPHS